jgi:aspartate carbamoyltransferase catalytic subunit
MDPNSKEGGVLDLSAFQKRLQRATRIKIPELQRNDRLKHVIFSQQFDKGLLDHLCNVASIIKQVSLDKDGYRFLRDLLCHKRAMLYFTQPSTRTFLSFSAALQLLGIQSAEIRDASFSSEYKGESPLDSVRMFSSYFDMIIMRSKVPDFAEACAYLMNDLDDFNQRNVPIVNAGAGADEHPTQALLDIYTIQRTFAFESDTDKPGSSRFDVLRRKYPDLKKGLSGKIYGFVGDVGRGRTVRSLAQLLAKYEDVTLCFISPNHPKLRISENLRSQLLDSGVKILEPELIEDVIGKVDLLYVTRFQQEHDRDDRSLESVDYQAYHLTPELVSQMKSYAGILHPFPRREEIPTAIDSDPRALYFHQARNGMWIRSALIAYLFDADGRIVSYYTRGFSNHHDYNKGVL